MLLEFTVGNFKSISEPQKLSLVPSPSGSLRKNRVLQTGNSFAPRVLTSLCLLGANGSGKSSLLGAMDFVNDFVRDSASRMTEGDEISVTPFKLDPQILDEPSFFEVLFVFENALYQFGFTADRKRVFEEWLFTRPNEPGSRIRQLYYRRYDSERDEYDWSINENHVRGERETWRKATRSNALFLSTAIQLNSESLRTPFTWLTRFFRILLQPNQVSPRFTQIQCQNPKIRSNVLRFIQSADINIRDIEIREKDFEFPDRIEEVINKTIIKRIRERNKSEKDYTTITFHESVDGSLVAFDFDEESAGTKMLFALAGPWLDVLEKGYTLIVDELHNSLHPLALKHLISMFNNPRTNRNGAQLVFSTHDTSVISRNLMHRDQIWLIEKPENASHLYPLSDFTVRDTESFAKGYLDGRFGGLPHPREFEFNEE